MKKAVLRSLTSALCALVLVLGLIPSAQAAGTPAVSDNALDNCYGFNANAVKSYLYINASGGLTRVEALTNKEIVVEDYSPSFALLSQRTIPGELEYYAGFFPGQSYNFFVFVQRNNSESDSVEVVRVVKYDKSWNRLGAADISNCYTTTPYDFTKHTAMAEENGTLVLHTSRQRYLTRDDGLRHQSNFTAKIRTSDMAVIYQSDTFDKSNYASHSFAQYVAFDGGKPVYVDHGDAYPRGFNLSLEGGRQQNFFPFSGATGDNTTNAVPGGLGISGNSYLFAGASSPQKGGDDLKKANAFLAVIPKNGGQAQIKWLTSLPSDGSAFVNDVNISRFFGPFKARLVRTFGVVSQQSMLIRKRTIMENLLVAGRASGMGRKSQAAAEKALGLVGLPGVGDCFPAQLSIGEVRRVELARALLNSPSILLLDELTANLDDDTIWDIIHLLYELNNRGTTIIMATHASQYVNIMRRRVVTLVDGRLIGDVKNGKYGDIV